MFELVAPSGHELATRRDIDDVLAAMSAMEQRWEGRFAAMDERWEGRFAAMDERWEGRLAALGHRLEAMEHRLSAEFSQRITAAVTMQTRTLVFSQLGAVVVIAALAFGLR